MNHVLIFLLITIFHFHNPPQYELALAPAGATVAECEQVAAETKAKLLKSDPTAEIKDVETSCIVQHEGTAS